MTVVAILCLNHQIKFYTFWTSDNIGEERFNVCYEAQHRYFRFYGDTYDIDFFAWLYPYQEIQKISDRITKEYHAKLSDKSKIQLEHFLTHWEYLAQENLFPEFFLQKPKEYGFAFEKLLKKKKEEECNLLEIFNSLTLELDPLQTEPTEADQEDLEEIFNHLSNRAAERYNCCVNCQLLDRSHEKEFFKQLTGLQKTTILEQKWLALIALHYYQVTGITDTQLYIDFVKRNLLDNLYLIRKECYEVIKSTIFFNPKVVLALLDDLLEETNPNALLYSIAILKDFSYFLREVLIESSYISLGDFKNNHRLKNSLYSQLITRFQHALKKQEEFKSNLLSRKSFWKRTKNWTNPLPENIDSFSSQDQLLYYEVALSTTKLARAPFKKKNKE